MIILDKQKDYYDYLTGIYGVDSKLVLDRRNGSTPSIYHTCIIICGRVIELYSYNGQIYFGDKLDEIIYQSENKWLLSNLKYRFKYLINNKKIANTIPVKENSFSRYDSYCWVSKEIYDDEFNLNIKFETPIIAVSYKRYNEYRNNLEIGDVDLYPFLSNLYLPSIINAETIYQWLSTWLGLQIERLQEKNINVTDKQKLINKGFDEKPSFRPNIRKIWKL